MENLNQHFVGSESAVVVIPVINVSKKESLDKNEKKEILCDQEKRMDDIIKV